MSVDMRNSKKVQAAIRLWKGGDTQGELKAKYQDESATSMCRLAEKLIKADKKKQLRECKVFITLLIGVSMVETLFTPVYGTVH